jgi:nucleotide-binding universal stress UspA family protein
MIKLEHVLVATDFSDPAAAALSYGRELARQFGATLHLVHVVDDIGASTPGFPELAGTLGTLQLETTMTGRMKVDALLSDRDRAQLRARSVVLTALNPARAILAYARDHQVNLIVMGTHGRGAVARMMMGSVAERVVRSAPCPVLTVHSPRPEIGRADRLQQTAHV